MDARYQAIVQLFDEYFDGLYLSDAARLARVFHADALYLSPTEQPLLRMNMTDYLAMVAARQSPASRGEPRNDRIISIEFGGANLAFVRAECSIGPKFFTDFMTLIFIDERWQIISKVFHFDLRS